jgi:hypothetical protein
MSHRWEATCQPARRSMGGPAPGIAQPRTQERLSSSARRLAGEFALRVVEIVAMRRYEWTRQVRPIVACRCERRIEWEAAMLH